jgi:hypothetical protein
MDSFLDRNEVGHIRFVRRHMDILLFKRLGSLEELVVDVQHGHVRGFSTEYLGDSPAVAHGCSGDDRDLVVEHPHCHPTFLSTPY